MSIADHFERVPDAGLNRGYDSGGARRQFQASLMLVTLVAVVATALGVLVRFDGPSSQPVATLSFAARLRRPPRALIGAAGSLVPA